MKKMNKMKKKGFTLVEIMIVVAIIGLLAAIGIPSFQKARSNTMKKNAINNARICINAAQQYSMEEGLASGTAVDWDDVMAYVKGGESGLAIGAVPVESAAINPDADTTAAALAETLYTGITWN